jgi:hypothetical protein
MSATTPIKRLSTQTGCYLYAIVAGADGGPFGVSGIDGSHVYTISNGRLAAVVSDVPNEKLRPERRRLTAHHEVLKRLLARGALLPMAFGIIADGVVAIERILALNDESFAEQLARLEGAVEMGLRVRWDVPNIFDYFVSTQPELRLLRDQVFRGGREPTQDDCIELGRLFDRSLTHEREVQTAKVLDTLSDHCIECKENKPRNEREVLNLACLIRREAQKEFEQAVFETAKQFDNHYAFDFNGPWPAQNFVDVDLQL